MKKHLLVFAPTRDMFQHWLEYIDSGQWESIRMINEPHELQGWNPRQVFIVRLNNYNAHPNYKLLAPDMAKLMALELI